MHVDKGFDGLKQTIAQAAVMRATSGGGDQVDIAFAQRRAVFGKGHAPGRAFAFGKAVVVFVGKALALKQGDDRLAMQALCQIVTQAALELPSLRIARLFIDQRNGHTGHEHGFAAQQMHQLAHGQGRRLKIFGIRPGPHGSAMLALAGLQITNLQRLNHITSREHQRGNLTIAVHRHFKTGGQRIGHRDAHAVQAAGEAVSPAIALVELAPCVQTREDQLHHGCVFFRVHAKGNAATIVFHAV